MTTTHKPPMIQTLLDRCQWPLINSIIFSDGQMLVLESHFVGSEHQIRILCNSTITSFFEYNKDDCVTDFDAIASAENECYQVFAGEGSYGSEGVAYVLSKTTQELLWFLYLDNSNPFEEIRFNTSDTIIIRSSSGIELQIPIEEPHKIQSFSSHYPPKA